MLFPTKEKCELAISKLLSRIEDVQQRLKRYEANDARAASIFGPFAELVEMQDHCDKIWQTLMEAKSGLRFGQVPIRALAGRLPNVERIIAHHEIVSLQMEATKRHFDAQD